MNIGFDLDKIFIDYPPFIPDSLIDSLYRKTSSSTLSYRIPSLPEQIIRKVSHHSIFRPPIKNNISFMRGIFAKKKNKYFLISSRFGFLKRETYIILKKYQLDKLFHGIHFNFNNEQPHLFKNKTFGRDFFLICCLCCQTFFLLYIGGFLYFLLALFLFLLPLFFSIPFLTEDIYFLK